MNIPPITLPQFLEQYSWTVEDPKIVPAQLFLWHFDLPASAEKLWPFLSDTSFMNREMGVPAMTFYEKEGRRYGYSKNAGLTLAWEELPWEWEYAKGLHAERVYSKGFVSLVRAAYILEALDQNQTRLYVYFGWHPRHLIGKGLISLAMKALKNSYAKLLNKIVSSIQSQEENALRRASLYSVPFNPQESEKISYYFNQIEQEPVPQTVLKKAKEWLLKAREEDLSRIRIRVLAHQWNKAEEDVLLFFLYATRKSLFLLTWDVVCPHCRGVREEIHHLGEVPAQGHCDICEIDFDSTSFESLEVTFRLHPSIREVSPLLYCSAEPSKKAHIKIQRKLMPEQTLSLKTCLGPGTYFFRQKGEKKGAILEITETSETSEATFSNETTEKQVTQPNPLILLKNLSDHRQTFVIEEKNHVSKEILRPSDLFNFQEFRDLFSEETIGANLKLDIGAQTILFTDVVGSTRFYEEEGDAKAFKEIRKHFIYIYQQVKAHHGAIVKTIGDAAMASFREPIDALYCAVSLQRYFRPRNPETALRLRISLHIGPCLAVKLNSNIDYFGSTVNFAAKLQKITDAGQITFTESIRQGQSVQAFIQEQGIALITKDFLQEWNEQKTQVYCGQIS